MFGGNDNNTGTVEEIRGIENYLRDLRRNNEDLIDKANSITEELNEDEEYKPNR